MNHEIKYSSTNERISIFKEFLDDNFGDRDWDAVTIMRGADIMLRKIGRSKHDGDSWDFIIFKRDGYRGRTGIRDIVSQIQEGEISTDRSLQSASFFGIVGNIPYREE